MTEKTQRGFNIWEPVINDRWEEISFQESSAMGLNTWLIVKKSKNLNVTKKEDVELEQHMIHLGIEELVDLRNTINKVIRYQLDGKNGRASWYK